MYILTGDMNVTIGANGFPEIDFGPIRRIGESWNRLYGKRQA